MTLKKWLAVCAVLAAATARTELRGSGAYRGAHSHSYGDVGVTPVPFASQVDSSRNSGWGHGYFYAFMDVANFSSAQSREVAFHYALNCRTAPVVLKPGGKARVRLPMPPFQHGWNNVVTPVIDGRFYHEGDDQCKLLLDSASFSRGTSPCVLLSPKISANAVRYRIDQLKLEKGGHKHGTNTVFLDALMPLAEWPDEWPAYSRFDALAMAAEDFDALPPAVLDAINCHVLAGGRLVVAGRGGEAGSHGLGTLSFIEPAAVEEWGGADVLHLISEAKAHNALWPNHHDQHWKKAFAPLSGGTMLVVYLLLVAITIGMGPVLMWRLARRDRRIHIYWIAPLAAFATGLAVVLVAFCMDGVAPVLRVNAVVKIDAEAGAMAVLSHAALKTPIGVRGGMVFGRATEVTPLEDRGWRENKGRRVEFADVQRFNNAWLPPRTPAAFLLREVKPAPEKTLEIISETDGGLVVANHLGLPLAQIYARGSGDVYYKGGNIPAGVEATLKPVAPPAGLALNAAEMFELAMRGEIKFSRTVGLPERSYVATVPGAPFTETFLSVKTKAGGATLIHGAFQKEDLP